MPVVYEDKDTIDYTDHEGISGKIKHIPFEKVAREWAKISAMTCEQLANIGGRSKIGCDIIDRYFFTERLQTVGNKGITFFDFLRDVEIYKQKHYIRTLLSFCDKNNRYKDSLVKRYYYIYGLCFGRINAFKITNALYIYKKYPCTRILDPFCGFGGRLVAAAMTSAEYRGLDINHHLVEGYERIFAEVIPEEKREAVQMNVMDSGGVDFVEYAKTYAYDMVCTSPPYKNIEIYRCSEKRTHDEWDAFYRRVFLSLWTGLKDNGTFVININEDVYCGVLEKLFGPCSEKFLLTKTKKNSYDEYVYVWIK